MMTKTDVRNANGQGYMASCNVCGKQASYGNMPTHIEGNHITGVSHACDICGKVSRSREGTRKHKTKNHIRILQEWSRHGVAKHKSREHSQVKTVFNSPFDQDSQNMIFRFGERI